MVAILGCSTSRVGDSSPDTAHYQNVATQIEYPVGRGTWYSGSPCDASLAHTPPPRSLASRDLSRMQYRDMSLQEVIQVTLTNSRVLLDLGGTVLRTPESVQTTYSIAVQETDPEYGPEAALSAFDAQFSTSLYALKNNQQYNNTALGTNGIFVQNYDEWDTQVMKTGVTGGQYTIRNVIDFARDNNVANLTNCQNGAFDSYIEGMIRQPLLQGAGAEYNRIAGPGAKPGVYNGVLVARIRSDISIADFELGLRDYVSNVENAYWDLYFAYRDLDIKVQARDEALRTWRGVYALWAPSRGAAAGGEDDKEAQAREQYFRFKQDVEDSLAGRPVEGTRTNNGSQPGTFRATPGLLIAERRLRLLMGLPATDDKLLRPADEPALAPVDFDWSAVAWEALVRREELRRQRWIVQSRELEMAAARNFLLPNLDLVARYRLRGFGHELTDSDPGGALGSQSAYSNLFTAEHQEWQVGAEFSMPLGFRQGHAAVRNAELRLTQARAVLRDEERTVISELSTAVAEKDRAFIAVQTAYDRSAAAERQLGALRERYKAKKEGFFEVLDAQRQLTDALDRYYQSRVDYALAIRSVHFEKGSLLEYCDIRTSEGAWPDKAYSDAARRDRHRGAAKSIDYAFRVPPVVAQRPPAQFSASPSAAPAGPAQPAAPPAPAEGPVDAPLPNPLPNSPADPAAQGAAQPPSPAAGAETSMIPEDFAPHPPEPASAANQLGPRTETGASADRLFTPRPEWFRMDNFEQLPVEGLIQANFAESQR